VLDTARLARRVITRDDAPNCKLGSLATLFGATLDTAVFFTIAFAAALTFLEPANDVAWANESLPLLGMGPLVPLWVSLACADWLVKMALAAVALVPFRVIVSSLTEKVA